MFGRFHCRSLHWTAAFTTNRGNFSLVFLSKECFLFPPYLAKFVGDAVQGTGGERFFQVNQVQMSCDMTKPTK